MRPILYGDLHEAARRLACLPLDRRQRAIGTILDQAQAADRWRKKFGVEHSSWGNGSLVMAVARAWPEPERSVSEIEYLSALAEVALAIALWRRDQDARGHSGGDRRVA
jgi:hypothetical protein